MSDQDVNIRIKTSADTRAAKEASRAIGDIERELREARQAFKSAEQGSKGFASTARQVSELSTELDQAKKNAQQLGSRGSAGGAVLEFSRAFEDAQYGIRGVLNNIPTLVAQLGGSAGLAGVISVVAVVGSQLWERMSKGAAASKMSAADYGKMLEQISEAYNAIERSAQKTRDAEADALEDANKDRLRGMNADTRRESQADELELAREKAQSLLEIADSTLKIKRLESALVYESGDKALQTQKDILAEVEKRFQKEIEIADMTRKAAIQAAETKVKNAQSAEAIAIDANQVASFKLASASGESADLWAKRDELLKARVAKMQELTRLQDEAEKQLASMPAGEGSEFASLAFASGTRSRMKELSEVGRPSRDEIKIQAEIDAKQGGLESLQEEQREASQAQKEAADKLLEAAEALRMTETQQNDAARFETQTAMNTGVGGDVGKVIDDSVAMLSAQPSAGVPGPVSEAISRLKAIAGDDVADGEQAGNVAGILQSVANSLTSKDQTLATGLEKLIRLSEQSITRFEALKARLDDLEARSRQPGPR